MMIKLKSFFYMVTGFHATAKRFNEINPDPPIDVRYASRLIQNSRGTLSVKDKPRSGRPNVDETTKVEVIGRVSFNAQKSPREISQESNIQPILVIQFSFRPYKFLLPRIK